MSTAFQSDAQSLELLQTVSLVPNNLSVLATSSSKLFAYASGCGACALLMTGPTLVS